MPCGERSGRIGEVLALARHRRLHEAGDERRDEHGDETEDEHDRVAAASSPLLLLRPPPKKAMRRNMSAMKPTATTSPNTIIETRMS